MALYYDAASILSSESGSGSLKSRIYNSTGNLKSKPAQLYALISETAKRDVFLKEVVDNTPLLKDEPKLTPLLSLLLCHDHFFSKSGIAAPAKHPLRQTIERHKARLQSEFTRARLRRKCGSIEALKEILDAEKGAGSKEHPRWARINPVKTGGNSDAEDMILKNFTEKSSLNEVLTDSDSNLFFRDHNVPDLIAFSPNVDLTSTEAYRNGHVILQDKASCFPAHLLLGDQGNQDIKRIMDACAAPGNKTTHLAAIAYRHGFEGRIYACERDPVRSKTLENMVGKAGATQVKVLKRQDFLALDLHVEDFRQITHLLLDPSCSGSGILGRADIPQLALPVDPRAQAQTQAQNGRGMTNNNHSPSSSKKRKRTRLTSTSAADLEARGQSLRNASRYQPSAVTTDTDETADPNEEATPLPTTQIRLQKLSNLQTRIVEHAMTFPSATRITYSTCSIHNQENELVVSRVLASEVARSRRWRVLYRDEQVDGLRRWRKRGVRASETGGRVRDESGRNREGDGEEAGYQLSDRELEACIRCDPDDEERTMGFFVVGFVRDVDGAREDDNGDGEGVDQKTGKTVSRHGNSHDNEDDEEYDLSSDWEGFDT